MAEAAVAMDVFHLDRRVVDEHPDGQRQARPSVMMLMVLPVSLRPMIADQMAERDRGAHDDHAAPAARGKPES